MSELLLQGNTRRRRGLAARGSGLADPLQGYLTYKKAHPPRTAAGQDCSVQGMGAGRVKGSAIEVSPFKPYTLHPTPPASGKEQDHPRTGMEAHITP